MATTEKKAREKQHIRLLIPDDPPTKCPTPLPILLPSHLA
jgi:hypothetical protein